MNCCEYRSLLGDALDRSIKGAIKQNVRRHLDHCAECRSYYERRRQEHMALFNALNKAYGGTHLPADFGVRVRNDLERTLALGKKSLFSRLPRWMRIAAVFAVMFSLVGLAATVLMVSGDGRSEANAPTLPAGDGVVEPRQIEDMIGKEAYHKVLEENENFASASTSTSPSNEKETRNVNTRKKMAAAFATAALAAASPHLASTASGDTYTSASYVQEGLIAQWDGIDNVGTGSHDSSATVWKDLAGSCDMTLLNNGESWVNGNALYVNGAGAAGATAAPRYTTIEVVYKMSGGACLFTSGLKWGDTVWYLSRIVAFSGGQYAVFVNAHAGKTIYVSDAYDSSSVHSLFAVYADNNSDSVVEAGRDGIVSSTWSTTTSWYDATGVVMVGDRKTDARSEPWAGEIYAIRLYNRALTYRELAANHAVDEVRFGVSGWYSYISSGDPVAAATANSCTVAEAAPSAAIEARYSTFDWSDGIALDATELHIGTMFSVR